MTVRTITAVVERLADDVRRTLGLPPQEPLDKSFAGLGGSSMEAAQLTVRLRRARGLAIGARELLNAADVQRLLDELVIRPRAEPAEHPVDAAPTGRAPLTWQQRVVWYQSVLDPGSSRHVFHALFHFAEAPRPSALRGELRRLLRRHPVLRTRIVFDDGDPWQVVPPADIADAEVDLTVVNLPGEASSPEELVRLSGADRPFDLAMGPLLRWVLVRLPDGRAVLVHTEHHLIHDGTSFVALLDSLADGGTDPDPRYFAYASSQSPADPAEVRRAAARAARITGPILRAENPETVHQDTFLRLPVPTALLRAVRDASRRTSVSLFTTLFTAFSQALTRHEGANAVVLGTAVENRPPGHEDTVGAFASIIPVVVERRPGELPEATLRRTNGALREAMDHSAVPLPDIVQAVGGPAGRGDGAVVRAAFSMHQRTNREVRLGGAHARVQLGVFNGAARFPVDVVAFTSGTGDDTRVELLMEAQDGAVDRDDLWALWTHTLDWLRTWVQLLPTTRSPSVPTLVERVRARATTDPNAVALDDGTHQVTYGRLAALGESVRHIVGRPGRSWVCWGRRPRTSSPAPTPSCTPAGPIFRWRPDSPPRSSPPWRIRRAAGRSSGSPVCRTRSPKPSTGPTAHRGGCWTGRSCRPDGRPEPPRPLPATAWRARRPPACWSPPEAPATPRASWCRAPLWTGSPTGPYANCAWARPPLSDSWPTRLSAPPPSTCGPPSTQAPGSASPPPKSAPIQRNWRPGSPRPASSTPSCPPRSPSSSRECRSRQAAGCPVSPPAGTGCTLFPPMCRSRC